MAFGLILSLAVTGSELFQKISFSYPRRPRSTP